MAKTNTNPEVRFAGFTEEWQESELGNLSEIIDGDRGINYPSSNEF